ncbi:MAG: 4-alpha-glucanotransferase [bacterium]
MSIFTCKDPSAREKTEIKKAIQKALKVLNKKNLSMIVHGPSFPSSEGQDYGIGSPNTRGGQSFMAFLSDLGFNGIQLGPEGKTKSIDASPYIGTMFSNNPLFIDLYQLTQKDFSGILSFETFDKIVNNNPSQHNRVAYGYIYKNSDSALREAFNNFKKKLSEGDSSVKKLNNKLQEFVKKNQYWLEKDALYEAISIKHGNDYWPMWTDELDKNLFNAEGKFSGSDVQNRIAELKNNQKDEIEYYEFVQFISDFQKQTTKSFVLNNKMKTIADCQVAFSDRDYWANQALFLNGWNLGCPPDIFAADGQAWGFPVMDPEKIFNKDGSLGDGGKLLKARFSKMFEENPGGVRIDHIIGLIDPFVYKSGLLPRPEQGASRLYSSPEHAELSKYSLIRIKDLNQEVGPESEKRVLSVNDDQIKEYARILENIVIEAAKSKGISKEFIICEDLGTITAPVVAVMEKLKFSGIRMTQFVDPEVKDHPYRIKHTEPQHWAMIGSHDNQPLMSWVDELYNTNGVSLHAENLSSDLKESHVQEFKNEIMQNPQKFLTAKFAELFASPAENIQIFFADFFGSRERYNMPGTSGSENWSLRIPNNYECYFQEQVAKGEAMNILEVLILAIEAKGHKFAQKHNDVIENLRKCAEFYGK